MKEILQPSITTLHNLLDYDASKFNNAEIQLKNILPDWIRIAGTEKLKEVLFKYSDFVSQHIDNFNYFIESEDIKSLSISNRIMHAFIEELEEKMKLCTDSEVKDACLLAGIQEINHFKISAYGTAAAFAKTLGNEEAYEIFQEAEVNEKQIDDRLTQLAKFEINKRAIAPIVLPK